jgi:hypothetical protein
MADRITRRGLGRALLARQLLLERSTLRVLDAVEHLVAMQAQSPQAPFVGLWSRLAGFDPDELSRLLVDREVVRATTLRTTVHLCTTRDYLALRPAVAPVIERMARSMPFGKDLGDVPAADVVAAGREELARTPMSRHELGRALAPRFPEVPPASLGYVATLTEPVVQLPPRGTWQASGQAVLAPAASWLGVAPGPPLPVDDLLLRYLAAYGPATVADAQVWSGLTGLGEVAARLRSRVRTLVDDAGRELLDLPDAPRPPEDVPAPVRFVPEYDNLLLSHADRSRVVADDHRARVFTRGAVLVDGYVAGAWRVRRRRGTAFLELAAFRRLATSDRRDVEREAHGLLDFLGAGDHHEIELSEAAG